MVIGRLRAYAGYREDGSQDEASIEGRLGDEAAAMHAQTLADLLSDTAETRQGRLFFPPRERPEAALEHVPRSEAVLTVITMSGLVLPNPAVPREHWSFTERMSVPALHLASWYATRAIYGMPRYVRKVLALDECHFLAMWPVGRALFQRVGRDTRKHNVCCLAASQDPSDTLNMDVANHVAGAFVGRIEDDAVAADALRLLRVPTDAGYEHAISTLSQPTPDGRPPDYREFVYRDPDGNVDRFVVDLSHNPALLSVVNTDARQAGTGDEDDLGEVDDYGDFSDAGAANAKSAKGAA
jgi:hypothetical protein